MNWEISAFGFKNWTNKLSVVVITLDYELQ